MSTASLNEYPPSGSLIPLPDNYTGPHEFVTTIARGDGKHRTEEKYLYDTAYINYCNALVVEKQKKYPKSISLGDFTPSPWTGPKTPKSLKDQDRINMWLDVCSTALNEHRTQMYEWIKGNDLGLPDDFLWKAKTALRNYCEYDIVGNIGERDFETVILLALSSCTDLSSDHRFYVRQYCRNHMTVASFAQFNDNNKK